MDMEALLRPRFARVESRRRAYAFVMALLQRVPRKNNWQLAREAGELTPRGMQRLLIEASWDADLIRDDLRAYIVDQLNSPHGVLLIGETGFLKQGRQSVGVTRQYCGGARRRDNQQVGIFLAYATVRGCAFIDRALYLPAEWASDRARREAAGVPSTVRFATKETLAQAMLERAFTAQVPATWVIGNDLFEYEKLRYWLAVERRAYALRIVGDYNLGKADDEVDAHTLAARLPLEAWHRQPTRVGNRGPRWYEWAYLSLPDKSAQGWKHWLLTRRNIIDVYERAYYCVHAPAETPLRAMVAAVEARGQMETAFTEARDGVGLADYEVRRWDGWHRHITLSLLAHAVVIVAHTRAIAAEAKNG